MRIVVIGAAGTIGKEVVKVLAREHQIVRVGRQSGDLQVDITLKASIEQLFPRLGSFDAVICTVGEARAGFRLKTAEPPPAAPARGPDRCAGGWR